MKDEQIKDIRFVFENVEVVQISAQDVATFLFDEVTQIVSMGTYSREVMTQDVAHSTMLILRPKANVKLKEPGNAKTLFERLYKYKDLVSIDLIFEDGTEKEIYCYWHENDEYSNRYQSTYLAANGHLVVLVDKNNKAEQLKKLVERKNI